MQLRAGSQRQRHKSSECIKLPYVPGVFQRRLLKRQVTKYGARANETSSRAAGKPQRSAGKLRKNNGGQHPPGGELVG